MAYPKGLPKDRRRWTKAQRVAVMKEFERRLKISKALRNKPTGGWKIFTVPKFPTAVSWQQLPYGIRQWPRPDSKYYLIINNIAQAGSFDMDRLFYAGIDGVDHSNYEFFRQATPYIAHGILFDPGKARVMFSVLESEWRSVKELAPDYTTSRRYR